MKQLAVFCMLCFALCPALATASPGMGGDRFAAADADKDGFLNRDEFSAAFPTLKKEAFGIIDADKDGRISHGEWQAFSGGHGMGGPGGASPHGHPGDGGSSLPLLPVPQQDRDKSVPSPGRNELPLLSPPGR